MTRIVEYDRTGQLVPDLFYELEVCPQLEYASDGETGDIGASWIRGRERACDCVYLEGLYEPQWKHACPFDKGHQTGYTRINIRVDLFGGSGLGAFVPDMFHELVVVAEGFLEQLRQSGLKGWSSKPVKVATNQSTIPTPRLWLLEFLGKPCLRPPRVTIPGSNECPFCRWEPVVCPGCHNVTYDCPRCRERIVVLEDERQGQDDPRFTVQSLPRDGRVVEGVLWDGNDFISGGNQGVVSRRAVEWLLHIGAGPFLAKPCYVDTEGMDTFQLAQLETLRAPRPIAE